MTSDLLTTLAAEGFATVPDTIGGRSVEWRVRRLTPADAARCGLLEGLIGAPVAKIIAGQGKPSPGQGAAPDIGDMLPALLTGAEAAAALAVVAVRATDGEPEAWQPVRLVADWQGADGTLPLSALTGGALAAVAIEALRRATEAGQAAVTFLGRPAGAPVAG